jgi:hypothetical protein
MERTQIKLDTSKHKNFATVQVHGLCKCGIYYEATLVISPLKFDSPNETSEMAHIHYTIRCWKCGRLVNLVSIEKEPLRGKEA